VYDLSNNERTEAAISDWRWHYRDQKAPTSLKPLVGGVHRYRAHHRPLGAAIEIGESILNVECTKFVKNANVGVIYG
jgi:hypothetical protein